MKENITKEDKYFPKMENVKATKISNEKSPKAKMVRNELGIRE